MLVIGKPGYSLLFDSLTDEGLRHANRYLFNKLSIRTKAIRCSKTQHLYGPFNPESKTWEAQSPERNRAKAEKGRAQYAQLNGYFEQRRAAWESAADAGSAYRVSA